MRRVKKQGGDTPSGENAKNKAVPGGASRAEFDYELLYRDEKDKQVCSLFLSALYNSHSWG